MRFLMRRTGEEKKIWKKRLLAAIVILLFVVIQETVANYHAITQGYDFLELGHEMQMIEEYGNQKYRLSYETESEFYAGQLKITGNFTGRYTYSIDVVAVNSFGKEEEVNDTDTTDSRFSECYTNINRKVKSIQITMPKAAGIGFEMAALTNRPEVNKYRILFWMFVLCFFYVVLFEKKLLNSLEWVFVFFAAGFGLLLVLTAQPERVSWDEQIHFRNAWRIVYGKEVEWSEAALDIREASGPKCNTKAEYAQLRNYMDDKGRESVLIENREGFHLEYTDLAYLPQALFLKLGMMLGMSFSSLYAFGKLGNLLVYILAMFWAIRLARYRKLFLLFFAMLPTVLFQAASYTYDNVVTSFVTLGCVLWTNMMFERAEKRSVPKLLLTVCLWVVGCFSKAVYIPVILLILLLPQLQNKEKRKKVLVFTGVFLVFALIMMTFVLPAISNTVAGNLSYGGDARGGDTSTVRQMISMLKHPLASAKLMLQNMFSLDNFRNVGIMDKDTMFFGNLMFLNFASLGMLTDKWSALLLPVSFMLLFYQDETEDGQVKIGKWSRGFMILVFLGILFLVWLALYLSFTPVGDEVIAGVQARYYLPLIYFLAVIFLNNRMRFQMERSLMIRVTLGTAGIFTSVMIYQFALSGRLF